MVMGGAGWGGDCVTRPSCFQSCYNLCSCVYPSPPMNWCFAGAMMIMKTNLKYYCNVGCNETEDDSYDGNGDVVNHDNNDDKVTGEELAL